ncbi:hypothetical protein [Spirosoma validum]|uniref:DUF4369 domain-containing protein n=1 Tax=Spirosoma validum TaxID=2771355 RepID=A0A927B8X1_9BACT|nr:hypothetical protein [Spirosoma validum]MBD2757895.1 hypothetical protein [Spirosoma validum]
MRVFVVTLMITLGFYNNLFAQPEITNIDSRSIVYDASLIQLIATPEKYHGKLVQVVGYLNLEFEGDAIYLHKEDFTHSLIKNAFWVDFSEKIKKEKKMSDYSKKYVIIIGLFDMNSKGHMSLFSGELKNIIRLDHWTSGR